MTLAHNPIKSEKEADRNLFLLFIVFLLHFRRTQAQLAAFPTALIFLFICLYWMGVRLIAVPAVEALPFYISITRIFLVSNTFEKERQPANSFCGCCGTAYSALAWPRSCGSCGAMTYRNPQPVSVIFVPVHNGKEMMGFVGMVRALKDGYGKWAPPGGFTDMNESAENGGIREGAEEVGLQFSGAQLAMSLPTPHGQLLVFSLADPIHEDMIQNAVVEEVEALEVGVLKRGQALAFPLHEQAMEALWDSAAARVAAFLAAQNTTPAQTAARRPAGLR